MHYVYKFLDATQNPIYIGITGNLKGRIKSQHFTKNGHLPRECYLETEVVVYSKCASSDDAKIKERYLINALAPKYNEKMKNGSAFAYVIEDFDWKYIGINKEAILAPPSCAPESRIASGGPIPNYDIRFSRKNYPRQNLELLLLDCYPGPATSIGKIERQRLTALCLNNELWLFYSQIDGVLSNGAYHGAWIRTVNALLAHKLDAEDCCVVENARMIQENIEHNARSVSGTLLYPSATVLIKASSVQKIMDRIIAAELTPETKRLARDGRFHIHKGYATRLHDWPGPWFYDLESYVSYLKNHCAWETIFHRIDALLKVVNRAEQKFQCNSTNPETQ